MQLLVVVICFGIHALTHILGAAAIGVVTDV